MSGPRLLAGLRVLEIGDGVAGAATAGLLWSLGAEVTALVDPASPHRRGRPSVDGVSLLSVILDRGKHLVPTAGTGTADVAELAAGADLVVVDRVGGGAGALASLPGADAYAAFVAGTNRAAWVTISAFGLTGGRRDDAATELTIAAAGGMLASVRSPVTGHPLKLAGQQSLLNTAQAAVLAACHAVDLAGRDGPVHLDLSAVEATIAMGPTLEIGAALLDAGGPGGARRYGAPASFYPCRDGQVRISAMEDHQWQGVVTAMGTPAWAARFAATEARIEGRDEIDERVASWTATLGKAEAETLLQGHGVPATAMYTPAETLASPQLRHRGAFTAMALPDGRETPVVGAPFRALDAGTSPGAPARRRSLRGLKVLEASHVLAAPLAGSLLGALGAEVVKLEDVRRLDMYRRRGPYIGNEPSPERSAYFALVNHSKRSVAFDVEAEPERLRALLRDADVVIENLGGKRAARLGLAAAELGAEHPGLLGVSSSGFGQEGPHASYRAYAYNLQASCCLGYLTRDGPGEPAEIDLPWADLVSGFALATLVAAWAVGPEPNPGAQLDFAMADLIVAHFNEFVAAAGLGGDDGEVDHANEQAPWAPNGVYPTADGWLAVSVGTDASLARLAAALGTDLGAGDRFARRHKLDALVATAMATATAAVLAAALRSAGVTAEAVIAPRDLPAVPQLVERDFFTPVEHPDWGRRRLIGLPWRPYGGPALPLGAPPRLLPLAPDG